MHEDQTGTGEFGRLLAAIQKRTGLSHQDIADAAGVNRSQVWRWVNSGAAPGYEPVRRLTAYLLAERPEVADAASRLLPAAGYETPPAPHLVAVEPSLLPATAAMAAAIESHIREIEVTVERARGKYPGQRLSGQQVFPLDEWSAERWDRMMNDPDWLGDEAGVTQGLAAMKAWREQRAEKARRDRARTG